MPRDRLPAHRHLFAEVLEAIEQELGPGGQHRRRGCPAPSLPRGADLHQRQAPAARRHRPLRLEQRRDRRQCHTVDAGEVDIAGASVKRRSAIPRLFRIEVAGWGDDYFSRFLKFRNQPRRCRSSRIGGKRDLRRGTGEGRDSESRQYETRVRNSNAPTDARARPRRPASATVRFAGARPALPDRGRQVPAVRRTDQQGVDGRGHERGAVFRPGS